MGLTVHNTAGIHSASCLGLVEQEHDYHSASFVQLYLHVAYITSRPRPQIQWLLYPLQ